MAHPFLLGFKSPVIPIVPSILAQGAAQMKHRLAFSAFFLLFFGTSSSVFSQKWADLTMTFVFDGDIPAKKAIVVPGGICVRAAIESEDLLVNPTSKGIANMVFMIDSKKTKLENAQLHPDLQNPPIEKAVLECKECAFVPHVMAMRAGQTLLLENSDPTGHNPNFSFYKNQAANPMIPVGNSKEVMTKVEEPGVTNVACSIHPWMSGYVIVAGHPYVGISDNGGKIKIEKLPAGIPLNFKLWHESQDKSIEELSVGGKKEKWTKGSVELKLKEGANDLGTILIKPDRFKSK